MLVAKCLQDYQLVLWRWETLCTVKIFVRLHCSKGRARYCIVGVTVGLFHSIGSGSITPENVRNLTLKSMHFGRLSVLCSFGLCSMYSTLTQLNCCMGIIPPGYKLGVILPDLRLRHLYDGKPHKNGHLSISTTCWLSSNCME